MIVPKALNISAETPEGTSTIKDIYSNLLDEQVILLTGEVNEEMAESIVAQLLCLEAKEFKGDIRMYIDSPGGSVTAGLAIYDAMRCIKYNISTICIGQAASMASVLLAAGAKGKRMAFPNARVVIHQPLGGATGQASDIAIQAAEMARIKKSLQKILVYHTGQPNTVIEKDTDRDFFLSADEAVEYGLIDRVMKYGEGIVYNK